jgi:hypothetical protein
VPFAERFFVESRTRGERQFAVDDFGRLAEERQSAKLGCETMGLDRSACKKLALSQSATKLKGNANNSHAETDEAEADIRACRLLTR